MASSWQVKDSISFKRLVNNSIVTLTGTVVACSPIGEKQCLRVFVEGYSNITLIVPNRLVTDKN